MGQQVVPDSSFQWMQRFSFGRIAAVALQNNFLFLVLLSTLFLLSFSIPIVVGVRMARELVSSGGAIVPTVVDSRAVETSPSVAAVLPASQLPVREQSGSADGVQAVRPPVERAPFFQNLALATFTEQGRFLRIPSSTALDPQAESEYAVLLWVRPRRLPEVGEGMVLLSKIDSRLAEKPGYQLSLVRDAAGLRPQMYWRADKRSGGVYNFAEVKLQQNRWYAFVSSVRAGRYLGMHLVRYPGEPTDGSEVEVELLGGYDLGRPILARSSADLLVGPFNDHSFRGAIGPVGVLSADSLGGELRELITSVAINPRAPQDTFTSDAIAFWTNDGVHDLSPHAHAPRLE